MRYTLALLLSLFALSACSEQPPGPLSTAYEKPPETGLANPSDRVKVEVLNVIRDTTAYNNRRGVYLITDTQTGQQFIGVAGVGISEVGSHKAGKTTVQDER